MTTLAKLNQCSEVAPVPVTKSDVLLSFAHLTIKLGKNDFDGVRSQLSLFREERIPPILQGNAIKPFIYNDIIEKSNLPKTKSTFSLCWKDSLID